ncbi:NAD(P)/FAD-dependent oxidoreductase [Desulfospira joergensenii]|uniref:NAD(P)/FAD-dependent oxidoreductase n=1 Tax=Desulfospira joergensenii TaxID=53329 RepID=UPI0003B3AE83|nr:FAD-dependent oxidoreductase [Desulfospira joergensenii]
MTGSRPEVLIIGGGVIGTSIAFHLARQSVRVTLVEEKDLASGSSGACDGLIFMQSKKPGIHLEMALKSLERFQELSRILPVPLEFRQTGGMVVIETEEEYRAMEAYARDQRSIGLDVSILDRDQAIQKEPGLSPDILGAAWSPLDGQVNPMGLTLGFALAAKKAGVRILSRTRVLDLVFQNNRVIGVETGRGRFFGDVVVNACGAGSAGIAAMAGLSLPVKPRKGQIVVTRAARPMISHCMISAKYIAAKYNPDLAREAGEGLSIEQTENGNLLLGSTREFAGFDTRNTLEGIRTILQNTSRVVPGIQNLEMIRSFAGLRPWTPDGLPLLGPVRGLEGFFMAAGHEGDGIALSPVTGNLVSKMILEHPLEFSMEPFSPDRFLDSKEGSHG